MLHLVGVVAEVVDGPRCGTNTGTDEDPFPGVARTGSNGGTAPGSYRSAGERPTAYHNHSEQGQSCDDTYQACLDHFIILLFCSGSTMPSSQLAALLRQLSARARWELQRSIETASALSYLDMQILYHTPGGQLACL